MKVILKQDHELLGDEGHIVEVKTGYARNFLIPKGIAVSATPSNLKSFEEIKKQRHKKIQKLAEEAKKVASQLEEKEIDIFVATGEDERIFGSVTSQMIYDALLNKGYDTVEKKKIILKEPIKSLGQHIIDVKLQHSVVAKIKVNVVDEKAQKVSEESSSEVTETTV